jgi:hypothetical protein
MQNLESAVKSYQVAEAKKDYRQYLRGQIDTSPHAPGLAFAGKVLWNLFIPARNIVTAMLVGRVSHIKALLDAKEMGDKVEQELMQLVEYIVSYETERRLDARALRGNLALKIEKLKSLQRSIEDKLLSISNEDLELYSSFVPKQFLCGTDAAVVTEDQFLRLANEIENVRRKRLNQRNAIAIQAFPQVGNEALLEGVRGRIIKRTAILEMAGEGLKNLCVIAALYATVRLGQGGVSLISRAINEAKESLRSKVVSMEEMKNGIIETAKDSLGRVGLDANRLIDAKADRMAGAGDLMVKRIENVLVDAIKFLDSIDLNRLAWKVGGGVLGATMVFGAIRYCSPSKK